MPDSNITGTSAARGAASLPLRTILIGDARERLAELPADSVDCIVTSPPYFALRDYGHWRQLGMETHVDAWVANIRAVCQELARVLKPSGSLWLNVADTYSRHFREGAPPKSMLLGPQRLVLGLLEDGWLVRNEVIWAKTRSLPQSVTDRLRYRHEVLYFLTRSPHYFFDLDAIRVPGVSAGSTPAAARRSYPPRHDRPERAPGANGGLGRMEADGRSEHPLGKNPGDVWEYPSGQQPGHSATFPLGLVERPLLATCPERVCTQCGRPWARALFTNGSTPGSTQASPETLGHLQPGCRCVAGTRPGVVLDPFLGSGTVALAAEALGREWVGIELNPVYAGVARARIRAGQQRSGNGDPKP